MAQRRIDKKGNGDGTEQLRLLSLKSSYMSIDFKNMQILARGDERKVIRRPFFSLYIGGLLIYLPLILQRLTNDMDGMWDQDDHMTGAAELRMGRWFWPILDKLRGNVSLDPMPAVVAIALFAAGILAVLALFGLRGSSRRERFCTWVIGMLILASPTVLCQLSYSHMSINDAFSFLLAVLAVWVVREPLQNAETVQASVQDAGMLRRPLQNGSGVCRQQGFHCRRYRGILVSALLTAVMMGCYQATLGVLCVTALFYFLQLLVKGTRKGALSFAGRMLVSVVLGAALYEGFLYACLAVTGETLSDYNGGNAVTIGGILRGLPENLRHAYTAFVFYFGGEGYHFNLLQGHRWFLAVYLLPVVILARLVWRLWREKGAASALLAALAIVWIPIFANSFFLLVYSDTMMQMTMGMAMVLPLTLCLGLSDAQKVLCLCRKAGKGLGRFNRCEVAGGGVVIFLLLYGMLGQTVTDQYAMYVGRRFTATLAEQVLNRFTAAGADYTENVVLVYGTPKNSPLFLATDLYNRANSYAQYGSWAPDAEGNRLCWGHFLEQQLRVRVNYAEGDTLETIYNSQEVAAMPVYPAAGSTANVWGVTVVKVSE